MSNDVMYNGSQQEHILSIFKEYTTPSRVLRSFTNLSNTVIQTALSGQSKFVFEILQNADDAFEDPSQEIEVHFVLHDNCFIVHHNGKGFDFNDVERICDYASQIEEVKATDLSKTGYKGLGFKSLFNLSDCIYISSSNYSFRFDKTYWKDPQNIPWQVIPIWCKYDELPLHEKYCFDQPVNFILKVNNINQLESQLKELVDQPELLLYLYRINKLSVNLNGDKHFLERKVEKNGLFNKIDFYKNEHLASTWLSRTLKLSVPKEIQACIQGASRFIYPDKIKKAKQVPFTFALRSDEALKEILPIKGFCYSTLPTQLHLTLPYHVNSYFILNLDRTQLHENEWNVFLIHQIGYLQLILLKDLAEVDYLKNYVIEIFVREISHPYASFSKAFSKGYIEAKGKIGWLPAHQGSCLLKLGEAWTDETDFFKQDFQKIRDYKIYSRLINYDVRSQHILLASEGEVKHFTFEHLFRDFPNKYYPQLTKSAYINFVNFLYKKITGPPVNGKAMTKLRNVTFLIARNGTLLSPKNALLEENENPIPDFLMLNPISNECLPPNNADLVKEWLARLGAKRLVTPIQVLRESILKWIDSDQYDLKITMKNHVGIINYLAKGIEHFTVKETDKLKERLLILTESNNFKHVKLCYLPDVVSVKELSSIISDDEKISSCYDINNLKSFFIHVGVHNKLNPIDALRKSILMWIKNGKIYDKLTIKNYKPIIEFFAHHYPTFEHDLTESEKNELKKIPVLTSDQVFQSAQVCFFDSAIPNIKGLEGVFAKNKLVVIENISNNVYKFYTKIGVSKKILPSDLVRRSILRWIQEGNIKSRITLANHLDILKYVAEQWSNLNSSVGLKPKEKKDFKKMPILTEGGVLRAACNCYWPISNFNAGFCNEIPGLKDIIPADEFVSSNYDLNTFKYLLECLGVRNLGFTDIYEKYSDHLRNRENVKWFFSQLVAYWKRNKANKDQLLSFLQKKLCAPSCLLAKNNGMYSSKELYSSKFCNIGYIDRNSLLLLEYEKLPEDLERYLGFKMDLDFKCIKQLLKAIDKNPELGRENTRIFFTTLLEQLRQKNKHEIRENQLSLFSEKNKLRLSKDLYYFIEEHATCLLESCYLKRINGMSHEDTLELAELCGVNTLPFEQEIKREKEKYDSTLKEFYLERLAFIVVQESKKLNENVDSTLSRLYNTISCIKLYQCQTIYVKYPFGDSTRIPQHFGNLTLYVVGKWVNKKSKIHDYLRKELGLETDIRDIIDMEQPFTEKDKQEWLSYQKVDAQKFYSIEDKLKKLLNGEEEKKVVLPNAFESVLSVEEERELSGLNCVESINIVLSLPMENKEKDNEGIGIHISTPYLSTTTCSEVLNPTDSVKVVSHHLEKEGNNKFVMYDNDLTSESSSDESSELLTDEDFCIQKQLIRDEEFEIHNSFTTGSSIVTCNETTRDSINAEVIVEVGTKCQIPNELETDREKRIQQLNRTCSCCSSTESIRLGSSIYIPEVSEKSHMKWLSEKYVFTFLQDHYKGKYPLSQFNLLDGKFTLRWLSYNIQIVWLNESREKGQSYDILLKKQGEVKRLIEVQSSYDMINDSFYICHRKFIRKRNQLAAEYPEYKEKYCIYRIFHTSSSLSSVEELNNSAGVYKSFHFVEDSDSDSEHSFKRCSLN
ncbi:DUF3883 domain-containing protein [Trichonephila clavata]|uniref:DUF3883 domain-containing protein n=1 Tax=Trichonephila clavata TaxID=2740835 RepID=A0A8X6FET9_TRICU|nr:DUF3883 domain-containing protein [Trichonephila clavata]